MAVPKKVADRIGTGLKRLVPIIEQQRARDVSEADTVTLVKDVLSEILGYDKYADLTGEYAIRGTYCDLAIRLEDKLCQLIEVKAVGLTLNERHLKQVVDYAANQGIEWVILTNAVVWQIHHIIFAKPIDSRLIAEVDITTIDPKRLSQIELLYPFSKEGFRKGIPGHLRDRQDATSRFLIAALLRHNNRVRAVVRRQLRRLVGVKVTDEEIAKVLEAEVIKRDALEGPPANEAAERVKKMASRKSRGSKAAASGDGVESEVNDRQSSPSTPPTASIGGTAGDPS